jgi:phenylpyruvate tautomerase
MPTLRRLTNVEIAPESRPALLARASRMVADLLFAGTADPAAYLELKSLGLPESRTPEFSRALCGLLNETMAIPPERVYIEFAAPPRHLFGWNNATF